MKILPISRDEYILARADARAVNARLTNDIRAVKKARRAFGVTGRVNQSVAAELSRQARWMQDYVEYLKACARESVRLQKTHYDRLPAIQQTEIRW